MGGAHVRLKQEPFQELFDGLNSESAGQQARLVVKVALASLIPHEAKLFGRVPALDVVERRYLSVK